jgi:signal transduction histidine kinase
LKDEFMAMVSHELRTPLTGVLSMAEVLESEHAGPLNERQGNYVRAILRSGERLRALVTSILSYTALVAGNVDLQVGACRLADLAAAAAAGIGASAAAKYLAVQVAVEPSDLWIETDGAALRQVLDRLLANAVKFTPEGGCIGIDVRRPPAAESAQITVWDTGIGMDSSHLKDVVQPFKQGDGTLARGHEGLGMGLAYVHQMLILLGGGLALESAPGHGSRFVVTLPLRLPSARGAVKTAPSDALDAAAGQEI